VHAAAHLFMPLHKEALVFFAQRQRTIIE